MDNIKDIIWEKLRNVSNVRRVSGIELAFRCPFCGDSKKDRNKKRFHVTRGKRNDTPIIYHCFNCDVSGILTPSVLKMFDIEDAELNTSLIVHNKTSNRFHKELTTRYNSFLYTVPTPIPTESNLKKKRYINNRLGINISLKTMLELKTIFDVIQFCKTNNLKPNNSPTNMIRLSNDYVGWLTTRNEFINMRDITNKHERRYDKYVIHSNLENTCKFYTIPTEINILSSDDIYINIAEGVFDIWGVYFHIFNQNTNGNIFVAVCGSGYLSVIKHFIGLGLFGKNVHINIFSDSDKDISWYDSIKINYGHILGNMTVYYNKLEKDFGVPKDRIDIRKKRL